MLCRCRCPDNKFGAALNSKKWQPDAKISVGCHPSTSKQDQTLIRQSIAEYEALMTQEIRIASPNDYRACDIRIEVGSNLPSQSYLGTDCLGVASSIPTLTICSTEMCRRTVLHELGHALAARTHEHQHPQSGIVFNSASVYADASLRAQHWTRDDIDHNILKASDPAALTLTNYDRVSVMNYPLPDHWVQSGNYLTTYEYSTLMHSGLSEGDKQFLRGVESRSAQKVILRWVLIGVFAIVAIASAVLWRLWPLLSGTQTKK